MLMMAAAAMFSTSCENDNINPYDYVNNGAHAKIDLTLTGHKLEWYNMYVVQLRWQNILKALWFGARILPSARAWRFL